MTSKHEIQTDLSSSEVVFSSGLTGEETVEFEMRILHDVHHDATVSPVMQFLKTSTFCRHLSKIYESGANVLGDAAILKERLSEKYDFDSIANYLLDPDDDPPVTYYCITPVPGISQVEAKITGKTDVKNLRLVDKETINDLFLDIDTPVCVIQTVSLSPA